MYPAAVVRRPVPGAGPGYARGGRDPYGVGAPGFVSDQSILKKLRLRIDTDDPQFPALKKLKMRGKDLNDLPPEVFEITELEILDLSPEREACIDYHLTILPAQIGQLVNLRVLMLDTNQLAEVPYEVGLLGHLERMSISNNHIRRLPDSFSNLSRLESFHAANNRFDEFPTVICKLMALRFLDLSDNLLVDLPDSIANLQRLECLLLVFNRLEHLPASICSMTNLHLLWLGSNRLRRLPVDFGRLRNLDWGFRHTSSSVVDGNPLTEPPVEICKQGVDAIAAYFGRGGSELASRGGASLDEDERHRSRNRHRRPAADDDDVLPDNEFEEFDDSMAADDYDSDRRRRL